MCHGLDEQDSVCLCIYISGNVHLRLITAQNRKKTTEKYIPVSSLNTSSLFIIWLILNFWSFV